MTMRSPINRRQLLVRLGLVFNGIVGALIGLPMLRFLLSPVVRGRGGRYESWVSLGAVDQYPAGETRLATYRNPVVTPADAQTANVACWVRRIDGEQFQVFAVNCAHLGCPVRWFPQSGLFMCPCHGGAYYADGARASGPPERGLFEHSYRVRGGTLLIQAGDTPTPGSAVALTQKRPPCA
jgi:Rieske Fe-S protein